ncbi:hypothetical protein TRFO_23090 [Tritrichomonas foetus]|uniref:Uncharacterized protein n=1 Tax=Tritrichomonas foetus TaxID=1144522 RepID=A0A1J4KAE5_9EUKA|nr:hypothetical protein TRFO_23090 [Tritrichomonas foetus]|eukprot:OHT08409.1 hypothetical protein TRFO_23090 [Tritrichomonas foetus]
MNCLKPAYERQDNNTPKIQYDFIDLHDSILDINKLSDTSNCFHFGKYRSNMQITSFPNIRKSCDFSQHFKNQFHSNQNSCCSQNDAFPSLLSPILYFSAHHQFHLSQLENQNIRNEPKYSFHQNNRVETPNSEIVNIIEPIPYMYDSFNEYFNALQNWKNIKYSNVLKHPSQINIELKKFENTKIDLNSDCLNINHENRKVNIIDNKRYSKTKYNFSPFQSFFSKDHVRNENFIGQKLRSLSKECKNIAHENQNFHYNFLEGETFENPFIQNYLNSETIVKDISKDEFDFYLKNNTNPSNIPEKTKIQIYNFFTQLSHGEKRNLIGYFMNNLTEFYNFIRILEDFSKCKIKIIIPHFELLEKTLRNADHSYLIPQCFKIIFQHHFLMNLILIYHSLEMQENVTSLDLHFCAMTEQQHMFFKVYGSDVVLWLQNNLSSENLDIIMILLISTFSLDYSLLSSFCSKFNPNILMFLNQISIISVKKFNILINSIIHHPLVMQVLIEQFISFRNFINSNFTNNMLTFCCQLFSLRERLHWEKGIHWASPQIMYLSVLYSETKNCLFLVLIEKIIDFIYRLKQTPISFSQWECDVTALQIRLLSLIQHETVTDKSVILCLNIFKKLAKEKASIHLFSDVSYLSPIFELMYYMNKDIVLAAFKILSVLFVTFPKKMGKILDINDWKNSIIHCLSFADDPIALEVIKTLTIYMEKYISPDLSEEKILFNASSLPKEFFGLGSLLNKSKFNINEWMSKIRNYDKRDKISGSWKYMKRFELALSIRSNCVSILLPNVKIDRKRRNTK